METARADALFVTPHYHCIHKRHAIDADHIAAIDNVTRRLISLSVSARAYQPATVGFWFSLGHSSVVIVATLAIVISASIAVNNGNNPPNTNDVERQLDSFSRNGGYVGNAVSAAFLLFIAVANSFVLARIWKEVKGRKDLDLKQQRDYSAGTIAESDLLVM